MGIPLGAFDVLVIVADVAAQSAFVEHQSGELATTLASLGPFGAVGLKVDAVVVSDGTGGRVVIAVAGRYDPRGTYAVIFVVGIAFVVGRIVGWGVRGRSRCGDAEVGRCGSGDCCYKEEKFRQEAPLLRRAGCCRSSMLDPHGRCRCF